MSIFATSHCRPAFRIFRTLTGFSVRALTIPQEASARMPVCAAGRTVISEVRLSRRCVESDDAPGAKGSTGTRSPRFSRAQFGRKVKMRKPTTAAIGAARLVLGAGGATLYTHAATGPAIYNVYEANVTDEDAYKKALPEVQKIIKENGGVYVAGGFNKAQVDHGDTKIGSRFVIIRYESGAAWKK